MNDDLRAKIAELRRLDAERRTYPHVGIAGVMRLDQALQIGDFLANEVERLVCGIGRLRAALQPFAAYVKAADADMEPEAKYRDDIALYRCKDYFAHQFPTLGDCRRAAEVLEGKP